MQSKPDGLAQRKIFERDSDSSKKIVGNNAAGASAQVVVPELQAEGILQGIQYVERNRFLP